MEVPKDVLPGSSQVQEETVETPKVEVTPEVKEPKGSKTPEVNLYAALEEERRKRKELEDLLASQATQVTVEPQEAFSDEGKLLENKIKSLESKLNTLEDEKIVTALYAQYPALRELSSDFESYRGEFPRTKIENVAKLFLTEKGLLDAQRKGLEKQSSSVTAPSSDRMTAEEVADLRRNNHRKYTEMLMSGKLKLEDL